MPEAAVTTSTEPVKCLRVQPENRSPGEFFDLTEAPIGVRVRNSRPRSFRPGIGI